MTVVVEELPAVPSERADGGGWPRILWVGGTVLLVVMVVHVVALMITGGSWTGPVSLRKPATFAETGWLLAWSVALILPTLRARPWQRHLIGGATLLFGFGETAIIGIQAWRGVPSHYNFSTPLDAALMRGGAAGTAGVFLIAVIVLLVVALRSRQTAPAVRLGVVAGIAVLLTGCVIGLVMIFNNSGVYQGSVGAGFGERTTGYLGPDPATVGQEYVLIHPDTAGGDLVLPHAIGVHGLLLLAVPAVLLARTALSGRRQLQVVAVAVGAVLTAFGTLLVHALRQQPLSALHPVVLALLAACAVALAWAYTTVAVALLRRWRTDQPGRTSHAA
ncbi:MAG: hypothetical protein JWR88_1814 [Pseudonocardia sp.]|nr:hypothetical protein [Pseudonocardia sp.]